jgi:hypothetical protein
MIFRDHLIKNNNNKESFLYGFKIFIMMFFRKCDKSDFEYLLKMNIDFLSIYYFIFTYSFVCSVFCVFFVFLSLIECGMNGMCIAIQFQYFIYIPLISVIPFVIVLVVHSITRFIENMFTFFYFYMFEYKNDDHHKEKIE